MIGRLSGLGVPGVVKGVVIDTSFFTGNYPEHCAVEGCSADINTRAEELVGWVEVLPKSPLAGDTQNLFQVARSERFTHLRLSIFPDGGVARLRVHGVVLPSWRGVAQADLAAAENGGAIVASSDRHYGHPSNMIMPGWAANMGDGWETKRRRGPGHDWAVVQLGSEGIVEKFEVDTSHFKGNFPDSCSVEGSLTGVDGEWNEILPRTKLVAHTKHVFWSDPVGRLAIRYVRLNIYPDGGIARFRVFGSLTPAGRMEVNLGWLNGQTAHDAAADLRRCCGSKVWGEAMVAARPFLSLDDLESHADQAWQSCSTKDYLEAFSAHPKIGQRAGGEWSAKEQAAAATAATDVSTALARANAEYEERHGFIFIVCATGKSAADMLAILEARLGNDTDTEIQNAAEEQRKITQLRLRKLLLE